MEFYFSLQGIIDDLMKLGLEVLTFIWNDGSDRNGIRNHMRDIFP
jgi:hypothetical protein